MGRKGGIVIEGINSGILLTKLWCDCGRFQIKNVDDQVLCWRCRKPMHAQYLEEKHSGLSTEEYVHLKDHCLELKEQVNILSENLRKAQNAYFESQNMVERVKKEKKDLELNVEAMLSQKDESIGKLQADLAELNRRCSSYASEIESLRGEQQAIQARSECLLKEKDALKSDYDKRIGLYEKKVESMKDSNLQLCKELEESQSSGSYYRSLNEKLSAVKVRDITQMFLDYMTAVTNAANDAQDLGKLRETISSRTEYILMRSGSQGIDVYRHEPGSDLGSGRVLEINEKSTDDPSLDGKVCKSFRYGCSFQGGLFPEIPEKLTVWVCPSKITEDHSGPEVQTTAVQEEQTKVDETGGSKDACVSGEVHAEVQSETPVSESSSGGSPAGEDKKEGVTEVQTVVLTGSGDTVSKPGESQ